MGVGGLLSMAKSITTLNYEKNIDVSPMKPKTVSSPVFIVGTPRSGTTLTAKILGRHSRIFMPGETHYYDDVFSRAGQHDIQNGSGINAEIVHRLHSIYQRYYELADQERINTMFPVVEDLAAALASCKDYGDILDRFMSLQMKVEKKQRWGNNAPRDLFNLAAIHRHFPHAKVVVCVRDVRAFLYSYKGKWKVTGEEYVQRLKKLYHPVVTSFLWKSSMRQLPGLERMLDPADRIIVRYEDLVTCPEQTVRSICATIEEKFEPGMLDIDTHNSSSEDASSGIFSTSIERWRSALSQEEVSIAQAVGRHELAQLGYELQDVEPDLLRISGLWLGTPFALWRALAANKGMRGPLIPYLYKRIISLLGAGRQG